MSFIGEIIENLDDYIRPDTLDPNHSYNLQNQSWGIPRKDKDGNLDDPVSLYYDELGKYPSNYETVWVGLQFQPVSADEEPYERVFPKLYEETLGANVKAAKGYYIIDLLRRGSARQAAYAENKSRYPVLDSTGLAPPADYSPNGTSAVASWAGRVFYAGFGGEVVGRDVRSPNLSNMVMFSVLIQNRKDFFRCYQDGDPTSRETSDVVDTDGGFIKISGAEKILALKPMKNSLIVIASNGVWAITGGSDYGFTATNYKVDKLSSFSGISKNSVVEEGGRIFFWGKDGIYGISRNQLGDLEVTSITEATIQTYYQAIPNTSKEGCVGLYDTISKTIRWVYKQGTPFSEDSETYELVLNTLLGAFSLNKIYSKTDLSTEVFSMLVSADFQTTAFDDDVYVDEDQVFVDAEEVIVASTGRVDPLQSTRYLAVVKTGSAYSFSFSYYNNSDFKDWNEVDARAYLVTGENIASDSSVAKQIPYLTMHFYRTENEVDIDGVPTTPSGCMVRTQWDWARSNLTKKFGTAFQAYRERKPRLSDDDYDTGHLLVTSKSKVRGRGKAFAMVVETEPGKDCQWIGWNLSVNGNAIT